jgi:microcystin-dependent protein
MSSPFLGEVMIVAFGFAPRGWAMCNGQLLPINQNQALFSLLGTQYGGNGQTTFALPNLQGRAPLHFGNGFTQGQAGGEENHTLITGEMTGHSHVPQGNSGTPNAGAAANNTWASNAANPYSSSAPDAAMGSTAITAAGGGQPHSNMQPYLVLNFIIAQQGIFPSRN